MTNQVKQVKRIIHTPEGTIIDGQMHCVDTITIILPNGAPLDINEAVHLLEKKTKPKKESKLRKGFRAFKEAIREQDENMDKPEQDEHVQVSEPTVKPHVKGTLNL